MTSFPELEKQGGNLTVEALLRGIRLGAEKTGAQSFRNIYVQLDNTNGNKCGTLIVACALLVALGICKKIKVNYLEVGHTHEDIDALIGSIVVKLRSMNLPTFDMRMCAIEKAISKAEASINAVEEAMGITDYESSLLEYFPPITGVMQVKVLRITADEDGVPSLLYKSNSTIDGWYPRPFEQLEDMSAIGNHFVNNITHFHALIHSNHL